MSAADTLTDWALAVPLPSGSKAIGRAAVRLVLVALAQHADADGIAYPAAETLADAIEGMARRDVRNALHVLESEGLIEPAASRKRNRSIRWRLLTEARDNSGRHLTAWALAVPLPSGSRAIGRAAVRLVLVALAQHADADGIAGPSAAVLADCIDGMSTRDARNALTALDAADIIEPEELARPGRATRWRI
ncbi:helix-turn-helix domain-containing protein, partial [Agromyces aerolatus]|uniref:helix-turn-helix domain-containing protein n=1 Tax=Agromyces sp. LY-1074 TaxID=3074080 RepID=UPI00285DAAE6